jgi:ADP-ribose pyrophosphatase YjhB (NUDIX family)
VIDETWYQRPTKIRERVSAGGVVIRRAPDSTLLVAMAREGNFPEFVLPKGGVEPGESLEQTARREIEEETGLNCLELVCKLGQTERLSHNKVYWIVTHFFLFQSTQAEGTPTDVAHHFGVWWYPIGSLPTMLWPDQRKLIETNRELIESLMPPLVY